MPTVQKQVRYTKPTGQLHLSGQPAVDGGYGDIVTTDVVETQQDSFTGDKLPGWKSRIQQGLNATTSASGVKYTVNSLGSFDNKVFLYTSPSKTPSSARRSRVIGPNSINFGLTGSTPAQTTTLNEARTRFAKKVEQTMTLFSGGVFLGELRETLRMIRNPGKALRDGVSGYLNNLRKNRRRLMKMPRQSRQRAIQSSYLEFTFGVQPAISDLESASSYLERRQEQLFKELQVVQAFAQNRFMHPDAATFFGSGVGRVNFRRRNWREHTVVLAGAVSSRASSPLLLNSSSLGLSLRSFVPTVWELLPWSFVADYFTNIGDVLAAWSNQYVRLAWGRETVIDRSIVDLYDQKPHPLDPSYTIQDNSFTPCLFSTEVKSFTRTPITNTPVPDIMFEIPGFGRKWINLAALATARRSLRLS